MRNSIVSMLMCLLFVSCGKNEQQFQTYESMAEELDVLSPIDSLAFVFQKDKLLSSAKVKEVGSGEFLTIDELDLKDKIVCYISDIQCSTCIDQELELIKEFYTKDDFVLLGKYSSERDFRLYLLLREFDLPAYLVETSPSNLLTRFTNPTYFKLDSDWCPSSVYFASISTPNKSRQYHKIMSSVN